MKIEILKLVPGYIEYFVDSKRPKLVMIEGRKHCIWIEVFWIQKRSFHFTGKYWSGQKYDLEMFKNEGKV